MRVVAVLALALLLGACASADTHISVAVGGRGVSGAGTASSGAQIGVDVQGSSPLRALLALGAFAVLIHDAAGDTRPTYDALAAQPREPALAPDRVVHEQDCTKPLENPGANLRCR